jgi:hypothetical protein
MKINLTIEELSEAIEAYFDEDAKKTENRKELDERFSYLKNKITEVMETAELDAETEYALGDTLNLIELIKSKI